MSIRTERVANEIKKITAEIIRGSARDYTNGLLTVTTCRMSPDLQVAKIYISLFGGNKSPNAVVESLNKKAGVICREVCQKIRLRVAPEFRFFYDDTLEQMDQIRNLVNSANKNSEKID